MALVDAYDGIIFDYGGVLVAHQSEADQVRMAGLVGLDLQRFSELYWAHRADYDRGSTTATEYWHQIAQHSSRILDETLIEEMTEIDTQSWFRFDEVMWEWLGTLKQSGKSLAMLSNMPFDLGHALKSSTDRLKNFDHVTLSYEVHSVKPEPAIYDECLAGLDLAPERTLFLDDRIENVQGAELLGIRSVQFVDRDDVLLRLRT